MKTQLELKKAQGTLDELVAFNEARKNSINAEIAELREQNDQTL